MWSGCEVRLWSSVVKFGCGVVVVEGRVPSRPLLGFGMPSTISTARACRQPKWPGWYPALQNPALQAPALQNPPLTPDEPTRHGLMEGRVPPRPKGLPAIQAAGMVPGPPSPGRLQAPALQAPAGSKPKPQPSAAPALRIQAFQDVAAQCAENYIIPGTPVNLYTSPL